MRTTRLQMVLSSQKRLSSSARDWQKLINHFHFASQTVVLLHNAVFDFQFQKTNIIRIVFKHNDINGQQFDKEDIPTAFCQTTCQWKSVCPKAIQTNSLFRVCNHGVPNLQIYYRFAYIASSWHNRPSHDTWHRTVLSLSASPPTFPLSFPIFTMHGPNILFSRLFVNSFRNFRLQSIKTKTTRTNQSI